MVKPDGSVSEKQRGEGAKTGLIRNIYKNYGIFLVLLLFIIILWIATPNFMSWNNIINIIRQMTFVGLVGMGVTCAILTGGIDLSPGSIIAASSVVTASFALNHQYPVYVPVLAGLGVGLIAGFFNGLIIAKVKIPPFIVTLGTMTIAKGFALLYCNGAPISNLDPEFNFIGAGKFLEIPIPIIILAVFTVITFVMLNNTKFGRHVYALGGNEQAAIISGINVDRVKIIVYSYSGLLAGLAGIVLTARISSGAPASGTGMELDGIAAAVIGGTSFNGGVGSVLGTIAGALIIGVIGNGMDLLNVNMYWQQIVKGFIIIGAVALDRVRSK